MIHKRAIVKDAQKTINYFFMIISTLSEQSWNIQKNSHHDFFVISDIVCNDILGIEYNFNKIKNIE